MNIAWGFTFLLVDAWQLEITSFYSGTDEFLFMEALYCWLSFKTVHCIKWGHGGFVVIVVVCLWGAAYGILQPGIPGMESMPSGVGVQSLNHWIAREVPLGSFLKLQLL